MAPAQIQKTISSLPVYTYFAAFIVFLIFLFVYVSTRNFYINNIFWYAVLLLVLFIVVFLILISSEPNSTFYLIMVFLFILTVLKFVVYDYLVANDDLNDMYNYLTASPLSNFIFIMIACTLTAMFLYYEGKHLKHAADTSRPTRWFVSFLFYIPCLLLDFANYVVNEFKMTSSPVYVLFLIQVFLVTLYFLIPLLSSKFNTSSLALLPRYAYLDMGRTIATADDLQMVDPNSTTNNKIFRKNYAISMWVYLNIQPPTFAVYSGETEIFNYGGKPRITYINNTKNLGDKDNKDNKDNTDNTDNKDKVIIYASNTDKSADTQFKVDLPKQKWHQIVLNYTSYDVDIYINGDLVETMNLNGHMPTYTENDTISISKDKGLSGAICNVEYHKVNLTGGQIAHSYNLLANKNPPINNLY